MSFRHIRHTQTDVWSKIQASLKIHRASRKAIEKGEFATHAARRNAGRPWDRIVVEETVWTLAKDGKLATEESAAVIKAAQEWARTGPIDLSELDEAERALYDAVQAFAVAFDPPADEPLHLPPGSATVDHVNAARRAN